jgi:transposase
LIKINFKHPMATVPLSFLLPDCELISLQTTNKGYILVACLTAKQAICPSCKNLTTRVHSYYTRHPADLPISASHVYLHLRVRRFRCSNINCCKQTFSEPCADWLLPYARRTTRLARPQQGVAMAVGARAGARLLTHLYMPTSHDTLLRLMRRWQPVPIQTPRVLGVDDWAMCKNRTYGTILIDLEKHRPIDLLPDRTSDSLKDWLQLHPGVEIITRDRSSEYTKGASQGAPQAQQVVDRWHLLENFKKLLQEWLSRIHITLTQLPKSESNNQITHQDIIQQILPNERSQRERAASNASRQRRLENYQHVKRLHQAGWSIRQIERELAIERNTVRKYIYAEHFPERIRRLGKKSMLIPYLSYLTARYLEGCHNVQQLWREIKAQGYRGSDNQLYRWLTRYGDKLTLFENKEPKARLKQADLNANKIKGIGKDLPSDKQLSKLMMQQGTSLDKENVRIISYICQDTLVNQVYVLSQQFITIISQRAVEKLDHWLSQCKTSPITLLQQFATRLEQDYAALRAALTTEWSNGQTEGQVNRLKMLKRQMYGRAKFDLIRLRVLYKM